MGFWDKWGSSILGLGGDLIGSLVGSHSASQANQTNIKNAREQRAWEADMSNTAVQRRADDIEKAGGNRALAFTNGESASTPSVSMPSVEATFDPSFLKGSTAQALMMKAQLANINADTKAKSADARTKDVDARIKESLEKQETEAKANRYVEQVEWDDAKTQIMRAQKTSSAAEAKRLNESVDAAIAKAKQQAELGKLDLDSAKRIAEEFGLSSGPAAAFMRILVDVLKVIKR